MGKIKRKKLSSFETKTLSELKEMNDRGNSVYIPYIQPTYNNYKHEISECAQKLTAGENVQITNEGRVNATDTRYTPGDNIEISSDGKVSYVGDAPQTYAAGRGLRLTNNTNILALNLETDGGPTFTSHYGSKLNPVTFKNNYTLELAGNAMDSVFIQVADSDRTGDYKVICLDNDGITLRISLDGTSNKKYYCTNGTTRGWYQSSEQPLGYKKISLSDYTHIAVDVGNIALLSMSALFLQSHNNKETIINMLNRTNEKEPYLVLVNDTSYSADAFIYEQGLLSMTTINSNAYSINYVTIAKFERTQNQGSTGYTEKWVSSFTPAYYINDSGSRRDALPPFCGNVLSMVDDSSYTGLYSTLRFIPAVSLDATNSKTTISMVSTEY